MSVLVALGIGAAVLAPAADAGSGLEQQSPSATSSNDLWEPVASAPESAPPPEAPKQVPCGSASATTVAGVDAVVAHGIYKSEQESDSVTADVAHITGYRALLSALAAGNQAAVRSAVHAIVYTPHWHIVRLRVLQAGRVLADVGGPDVIAPVYGQLTWKGKAVGSYVMSVQDDVGFVKLVTRYTGVPIDLYRNGAFLMGTLKPAPGNLHTGESVSVRGSVYQVELLNARAFPDGELLVALLIPKQAHSSDADACGSVRLAAWANVALHLAARFHPLSSHYQDLVDLLDGTSGGVTFVFSGSTRLAGRSGLTEIPRTGSVSFEGRSWPVFSWEPSPSVRIYFLTPPG